MSDQPSAQSSGRPFWDELPDPASKTSRRRVDRVLARWTLAPMTDEEWSRVQGFERTTNNHAAPFNELAAFVVGVRNVG